MNSSRNFNHSKMEIVESKQIMTMKTLLLIINCIILAIGNCGGPLLMRLYFLHGGKRVWFSSWLETAGFPVILIPLTVAYFHRRRKSKAQIPSTTSPPEVNKFFLMKPPLFIASAVIGILTGFDDYLYAYGVARLPISTSALIIASQLAFTAVFAWLMVKQKFTSYSINAVVLLTVGAGILALHTDGDRPKGETNREYVVGFIMTVAAAVMYGFVLPLVELTYKKVNQKMTYGLVMEIQMVMSLFATIVCTIGMIVNNDFKVIPREASNFGLGETKYYVVVIISGLIWQCFFMGAIGIIFCSSSLLSAIVIAVLLPVTEILAVIFYKESFQAEKGVSLLLSLWGFFSYFYGEIKNQRKQKKNQLTELTVTTSSQRLEM